MDIRSEIDGVSLCGGIGIEPRCVLRAERVARDVEELAGEIDEMSTLESLIQQLAGNTAGQEMDRAELAAGVQVGALSLHV